MENNFIPKAIETVSQAITADNAGDFPKALTLYKTSLDYFMHGLKYEKNDARRATVLARVDGYMKRAEELKTHLEEQSGKGSSDGKKGSGSTATKQKGDKEEKGDEEQAKLRGALSSAVVSEKPNIKWDDVAGLQGAKEALKETVILPVKFPQLFAGKRKPFKGILLYGPPGTGKSYLAKAVATEADSTFFSVSSSDLVSKWQGESEKLVRNLFEMARDAKKSIIFIDEVDSLCGSRSEGESEGARRIKTEFLVQMDGVGKGAAGTNVLVLGATNVPWELDSAIRRRFEKRVYIPLPEAAARSYMIRMNVGDTPNSLNDADYDELGEMCDGASGADCSVLVREALMQPLRKCQQAKQFMPIKVDGKDMLTPCTKYPNCPHCPPTLTSDPPGTDYTCPKCHSVKKTLWDIESDQLSVPDVCRADFDAALGHSHTSVSPEELERFVEWTKQFGEEGV
mmetsp:Transcript_21695/g.43341  ORF Transcript_21695/g.43341 Transcript_21695/m.43341 type:complete len:455 (+) Transcript_21695:269-1633(+)|eukprot:CAMPEP_0182463772 /NCGR_PEP_ID=MMETSP1319-20130603/7935_1 /TAXON_ID=172717 /ORGANISM="Bolidomonas pacifica, Strain RCC208" /LENGTH=454 /DNA_ID=CAMNT_0024663357 /DNA_START=258 /DNA_END=1622 /DNA_ORIENTATION=+